MKRADRLAHSFIEKTTLHCIYIAGPIERQPVKVFSDRLTIGPKEGNKFIYWRRYWVSSAKFADRLLGAFATASWAEKRVNFANWYQTDVDQAETRLRLAARDLGIALTANDDVVRRASGVISRYDAKLAAMVKAGEMKPLNKAYKAYRIANERLSRKALHYDDWLDLQLEPVLEAIVAEYFHRDPQPTEQPKKYDGPPPLIDDEETALRH